MTTVNKYALWDERIGRCPYFLYNSCLFLYFLLTLPYYAVHLLLQEHYRAGLRQRFGGVKIHFPPDGHAPATTTSVGVRQRCNGGALRIWLHGVSVGEIQVLINLGQSLETASGGKDGAETRAQAPGGKPAMPGGRLLTRLNFVYSTTTLAAQRLARNRLGPQADLIYFPLDIPCAVRRALDRVQPQLVVLAETELWPNFLRECRRRSIPVVLVNGRISDKSFGRYRCIRKFTRIFLPWIEQFLMQDQTYASRIIALGAPPQRVVVTGNMKADQDAVRGAVPKDLEQLFESMCRRPDAKVLIAGSTHPGEEAILARLYRRWKGHYPGLILVIAPRHVQRIYQVMRELDAMGLTYIRRSQAASVSPQALNGADILLLDTLGELSFAYRWAHLVFIGKSLAAKGGQNPMEAARAAKPLLFGPAMENFPQETAELLRAQGAIQVADEEGLYEVVAELFGDPGKIRAMGLNAQRAVENLCGATQRNASLLVDRIACLAQSGCTVNKWDFPRCSKKDVP